MTQPKKRQAPRDRDLPIHVYVNAEERETIKKGAEAAGMSKSAFLRTAATGQRITWVLDLEAVGDLARVSGQQSRLGESIAGLLADPDPANRRRALAVLDQIERTQAAIREAVKKVRT